MFDWQGGIPTNAVEVVVGTNWSDRDINQMIADYYEENSNTLFQDKI